MHFYYSTHDVKHSGGFPGLARKGTNGFMAYTRIGPIHLAAGGRSGIEGARAYTLAESLFSIYTVDSGVFSHDGLTRLWVTFLYSGKFLDTVFTAIDCSSGDKVGVFRDRF